MRLIFYINEELYKRVKDADKIGRDKPKVAISTRTVMPMVSWQDQNNVKIISDKLKKMNEIMRNFAIQ